MKKILLIEDEQLIRTNLKLILEHQGYHVIVAEDGESGVETAKRELPDLILCDIKMPKKDGYQVLKDVRNLPNGLLTPFIFISAKVEHEDIRAGMNLGANDYLLKPVSREDLIKAIESRLEMSTKLSNEIRDKLKKELNENLTFNEQEVTEMLEVLTRSEKKILHLISSGKSTSQIAEELFVSNKTVENHRHNISKKLNLKGGHSVLTLALKIKPVLDILSKK